MDELSRAESLLTETNKLGETNAALRNVCRKLSRRIKSDISFLSKHVDDGCVSGNISSSSNIPYLSGVLDVVRRSDGVSDVICDYRKYGIIVDVVCDSGKVWKKVIARNPQALHLIWGGRGQYGSKDIVGKALKYVSAATRFRQVSPPKVVYVFCNGVTAEVAEAVESYGVIVEGDRVPVSGEVLQRLESVRVSDLDDSDGEDLFEQVRRRFNEQSLDKEAAAEDDAVELEEVGQRIRQLPGGQKVFLDITTMLVYVSDVCNGGGFVDFKEPVLRDQALEEERRSALAEVTRHMQGRTLVTCRSAVGDFKGIVGVLGGAEERRRSEQLIGRLVVVPDCVSARFSGLAESGQIRRRSKVIFGSADTLKCDILTSNEGFVRAAASQQVHISALIHQPRALSEQKRVKMSAQSQTRL